MPVGLVYKWARVPQGISQKVRLQMGFLHLEAFWLARQSPYAENFKVIGEG
jgi:hypothetical protein